MTKTLNSVVQFLLGSGQLEGCYFGDVPPGEISNYWWRRHLKEAFAPIKDTEYAELARIRNAVAAYYRITVESLILKGKKKGVTEARMMAYLLCRALTPCSTTEIGKAFNRDHTSVVKGLEVMRRYVNSDTEKRKQYDQLTQQLRQTNDQSQNKTGA